MCQQTVAFGGVFSGPAYLESRLVEGIEIAAAELTKPFQTQRGHNRVAGARATVQIQHLLDSIDDLGRGITARGYQRADQPQSKCKLALVAVWPQR